MKKKLLVVPALLTMLTMASCAFLDSIKNSNPTAIKTSDVSPTTEPCGSTASNTSNTSQNSTNSTNTSTSTGTPSIPTSTSTSKASSSSTNSQTSADPITNTINITESKGYGEGAYVNFEAISGHTYSAYYKKGTSNTLYNVDSELVRVNGDSGRVDVLGLSPDDYYIKIVDNNDSSKVALTNKLTVSEQDRSGYAHFNYSSGVGAYNDNGTLKTGAKVLYVTNENKNTITYNGKTGLVAILQNQANSSTPLNIRIIGSIKTNQYKAKSNEPRLADNSNLQQSTFFDNELETTYGENLVGLTVTYMDKYSETGYRFLSTKTGLSSNGTYKSSSKTTTYKGSEYPSFSGATVYDDDSYFNMLDVSNASNITIEGVGVDAEIFQWGFTWNSCKSIEIKNITFTDYPEDACSFEGSENTKTSVEKYKNIWVHNNTFNRGKNNWDISGERDKYAGDGGIDLKYIGNVTLGYNEFYHCKKTGLVGGSNSDFNKNITFHHNYYNNVESRLPLGRQANMHVYNNYYYNCGTCQDLRASAFMLSEENYFYSCKNPQLVDSATIKSYNDILASCGTSYATVVTTRAATVSGNCTPDGSTNYANFDTNPSLFYYANGKSNVTIMNSASEVPTIVPATAGAGKFVTLEKTNNQESSGSTDTDPEVIYTKSKPTEAGIYGTVTGANSTVLDDFTAECNAQYSNNKFYINDTSDAYATNAYYMFENTYNSGKVTYTINVSLTGVGSKWNIVQFLGATKNIAVRAGGLNTDDKLKYAYSLDGGTSETIISSSKFAASTSYTIILTMDYTNSTAKLSINGTEVTITGYTLEEIKGIQFMTANSATDRSYTATIDVSQQ